MVMRVFQQKEPKMPGAHKIGAAISGPRITGGNFMDTLRALFLDIPWNDTLKSRNKKEIARLAEPYESTPKSTPGFGRSRFKSSI